MILYLNQRMGINLESSSDEDDDDSNNPQYEQFYSYQIIIIKLL